MLAFILLLWFRHCVGNGYFMTQSSYCSRSLASGTYIMNQPAVQSSSTISVYRGSTSLTSGSVYVAGEQLRVSNTFNLYWQS
jgi:hypothetical protein